jgi:hypothetical protein
MYSKKDDWTLEQKIHKVICDLHKTDVIQRKLQQIIYPILYKIPHTKRNSEQCLVSENIKFLDNLLQVSSKDASAKTLNDVNYIDRSFFGPAPSLLIRTLTQKVGATNPCSIKNFPGIYRDRINYGNSQIT